MPTIEQPGPRPRGTSLLFQPTRKSVPPGSAFTRNIALQHTPRAGVTSPAPRPRGISSGPVRHAHLPPARPVPTRNIASRQVFLGVVLTRPRTHAEDRLWPPSEAGGDARLRARTEMVGAVMLSLSGNARLRARTEMVGAVMLSLSGNARFRACREDRIHRSQSPVPQGPSPRSRGISCGDLFPRPVVPPDPAPTRNVAKRDSIRSKVFERGGMGVRGKGGGNFLQKVSSPLPPIFLTPS